MPVGLDTSELEADFEDLAHDEVKELANRWYAATQEILFEAGDELEWDIKNVARGALPPEWNDAKGGFEFVYQHEAARYLNDGTAPHEIEAQQAETLAFEWEDAPPDIRDMFESTFPTVFFPKIEHPGTPAIRFLEGGKRQAIRQWGDR